MQPSWVVLTAVLPQHLAMFVDAGPVLLRIAQTPLALFPRWGLSVVEVMCERGMVGIHTLNFALLQNILGLLRVNSQRLSCGIYRGDRGRGE